MCDSSVTRVNGKARDGEAYLSMLILCCVQLLDYLDNLLPVRMPFFSKTVISATILSLGMADDQFFQGHHFFLGEFVGHQLSAFFGSSGDEAFSGCVVPDLTSSIDSLSPSHILP